MDVYQPENDAEKWLMDKALQSHTPISGGLELLPLCNMDCRMCYIHQTKEEMVASGRMLSCDEWIPIVEQAVEAGLLFLVLTGGEPLLYPEFKHLYVKLSQMGLVLTVNTNGTLIDREWAIFFAENGVRRINITLYGKDDATYAALCRNPKGYSQVMRAAALLKEYNVPFRFTCSVTPENIDQLQDLYKIAQNIGVPFSAATYMFPAMRRDIPACKQYRLTPEQAANATIQAYQYNNPGVSLELASLTTMYVMEQPPKLAQGNGFPCKGGKSSFWLDWKGECLACGMYPEPKINLLEHSFQDAWREIVTYTQNTPMSQKCRECKMQNNCKACPAACYSETGRVDGCPEYLCHMTEEIIRRAYQYLPENCKWKEIAP